MQTKQSLAVGSIALLGYTIYALYLSNKNCTNWKSVACIKKLLRREPIGCTDSHKSLPVGTSVPDDNIKGDITPSSLVSPTLNELLTKRGCKCSIPGEPVNPSVVVGPEIVAPLNRDNALSDSYAESFSALDKRLFMWAHIRDKMSGQTQEYCLALQNEMKMAGVCKCVITVSTDGFSLVWDSDDISPNVEVTGDPLEATCGAGMFVI